MTSIHAPIPVDLKDAVREARQRGEEGEVEIPEEQEERTVAAPQRVTSSVVMKKRPQLVQQHTQSAGSADSTTTIMSVQRPRNFQPQQEESPEDEEESEEGSESKENDPSLSASPVFIAPSSPRKNLLGKRPLSDLPTPSDPDEEEDVEDRLSASDRNIANNGNERPITTNASTGARKSPKLAERSKDINNCSGDAAFTQRCEGKESADEMVQSTISKSAASVITEEGKENNMARVGSGCQEKPPAIQKKAPLTASGVSRPGTAGRNMSTGSSSSASSGKVGKPRVGLRRL